MGIKRSTIAIQGLNMTGVDREGINKAIEEARGGQSFNPEPLSD